MNDKNTDWQSELFLLEFEHLLSIVYLEYTNISILIIIIFWCKRALVKSVT